jgi:tight adherence protein C
LGSHVIISGLAVMSAVLVVLAVGLRRDQRVAGLLAPASERAPAVGASLRSILGPLGRRAQASVLRPSARVVRRLTLSGSDWSIEQIAGLRVVLFCSALAVILIQAMAMPAAILLGPLLLAAAVRGPDMVLGRRGRQRQSAIEWSVPDLVELLVATTEAGLAPAVALDRSAAVVGGPLGAELRRVAAEVGLGVPWTSAMEHLVERTEVPSLRRLVADLARSHRLGTPVRAALRSVAGELRSDRRARAEEMARRAPVKMLFPLVFLILPAFLLLTVGPVVLATVHSLQSG